jgi:hypothetical protein
MIINHDANLYENHYGGENSSMEGPPSPSFIHILITMENNGLVPCFPYPLILMEAPILITNISPTLKVWHKHLHLIRVP